MMVVIIDDPRNWDYPFPRSFYEDEHVVYHGTSSPNSEVLETKGFIRGQLPFEISALRRLLSISDEMRHKSWARTTVAGLSTSTQLSRTEPRKIYFSGNFWFARSYATDRGGETVHNALLLCTELLARITGDDENSKTLFTEITSIAEPLQSLITGVKPVVYAVKIESEWFDSSIEWHRVGNLICPPVNMGCISSIPPERILAKVIYVNGAEDGYTGPQPANWEDLHNFFHPVRSGPRP
jgi:hypothetical protein